MSKILVPLDGSPLAEQALHFALANCRPGDELILLRVVDARPTVAMEGRLLFTELFDELSEEAREYLNRLAGQLEVPVRPVVDHGPAPAIIVQVAGAEKVDRIVLSSHGRSGLARWLLGSVAEYVIRHAACPVWLVPSQCRQAASQLLLIPLDGSPEDSQVVDYALTLPARPVMLLAATDILPGSPSPRLAELRHHVAESRARQLEEPARRLGEAGWQVECRVVDDRAAQAILDVAEASGAAMILLGTHGRTGWQRVLNGSVAEKVARHSHCPVVLLHHHTSE